MNAIEIGVIRVRLKNLLNCTITDDQVKIFIEEAKVLNMNPLEAIEFLEQQELSKEEIKKIIRGL